MKKFDLSWGHSVCVRDAFVKASKVSIIPFTSDLLRDMNYPPHEGDHALIELTREVIERQVGPSFKYIILTNGATGGATLALRAYAQSGYNIAFTRSAPYFPIYPAMVKSAGLIHKVEAAKYEQNDKPVALIDSPTNPQGEALENLNFGMPVIWDAVYHSKVYTYGNYKPLGCKILVGSYSKLLGINGLRTGWVATDDELLYLRLKELATAEYCGLSSASTHILLQLLDQFKTPRDWDRFESNARYNLDHNRGEWSKLEKYFGNLPVGYNGMFYYSRLDKSAKRLMTKSGILWTPGSSLGTNDEFGRFNLGQSCRLVKDAVKEIIKNDKICPKSKT